MDILILRSVFDCFMMVIVISISTPVNRLLINKLLVFPVHVLQGYFLVVINVKLVALNSWSPRSLDSHLVFTSVYLLSFRYMHLVILRWFMDALFLSPANCWIIIHKSIIFLVYSDVGYNIPVFLVIKFFFICLNVIPYQPMTQLFVLIIT